MTPNHVDDPCATCGDPFHETRDCRRMSHTEEMKASEVSDLKEQVQELTNQLAEAQSVIGWVVMALEGEEPGDFAESFPVVAQALGLRGSLDEWKADCKALEKELGAERRWRTSKVHLAALLARVGGDIEGVMQLSVDELSDAIVATVDARCAVEKKRVDEAEAQAAAKHAALVTVRDWIKTDVNHATAMEVTLRELDKAIVGDAGRAYLERLQAAEAKAKRCQDGFANRTDALGAEREAHAATRAELSSQLLATQQDRYRIMTERDEARAALAKAQFESDERLREINRLNGALAKAEEENARLRLQIEHELEIPIRNAVAAHEELERERAMHRCVLEAANKVNERNEAALGRAVAALRLGYNHLDAYGLVRGDGGTLDKQRIAQQQAFFDAARAILDDPTSAAAGEAWRDRERFEELARAVAKSSRLSFSADNHRKVDADAMVSLQAFIAEVDAKGAARRGAK